MISVKVRMFAAVRDLVGYDEKILLVPNNSQPGAVIEILSREHPRLKEWMPHLRMAVNWEYASPGHILHDQDEIALIPPVSGG